MAGLRGVSCFVAVCRQPRCRRETRRAGPASGLRPWRPRHVDATAAGGDERMPPPKTGPSLPPEQIEVLTRWVKQGAKWGRHWAFEKPIRPPLPGVELADWPKNPIDRFVLARLEKEGLAP